MFSGIQRKPVSQGVTLVEMIVALAIAGIASVIIFRAVQLMEGARAQHLTAVESHQEMGLLTDLIRSRFYGRMAVAGFELRDKGAGVARTIDIDEDLGGGDLRQTIVTTGCRPLAGSPAFTGCNVTCPKNQAPVVYVTSETTTAAARTVTFPKSKAIDGMAACFVETADFVSIRVILHGFDPRKPGKARYITEDWPMPKEIFVRGNIQLAP